MIQIFYTIFIIIIIYTIVAIYLSQTCCDAQAQRPSSRHPSWPPPTARHHHRCGLAGCGGLGRCGGGAPAACQSL